MKKSLFFLPILIFLITSCDRNEVEPILLEEENTAIQAELRPYFNRFIEEGAERGFQIDLEIAGITGVIQDIDREHVAGTCTYGTHTPGDIVIDSDFWFNSTALWKEMVIFHELGHCYLHRDHLETAHANGICTSIMRSGAEDCRDNYNSNTRETYIDELFSNQ